MGLFDRFKRRVKEVADEVNTEDLTVTEDSTEGQEIIAAQNQVQEEIHQSEDENLTHNHEDIIQTDDDDWEVFEEEEPQESTPSQDTDDDWEVFDDDDDDYLPQQLTRKEKKRLQKEQKQLEKQTDEFKRAQAIELIKQNQKKAEKTTAKAKVVKPAQKKTKTTKSSSKKRRTK